MAFSDRVIYDTLVKLIQQFGAETVISQSMISEAAGAHIDTTRRALRRLMVTGKVVGEFQHGIGYRYTLPGDASRS